MIGSPPILSPPPLSLHKSSFQTQAPRHYGHTVYRLQIDFRRNSLILLRSSGGHHHHHHHSNNTNNISEHSDDDDHDDDAEEYDDNDGDDDDEEAEEEAENTERRTTTFFGKKKTTTKKKKKKTTKLKMMMKMKQQKKQKSSESNKGKTKHKHRNPTTDGLLKGFTVKHEFLLPQCVGLNQDQFDGRQLTCTFEQYLDEHGKPILPSSSVGGMMGHPNQMMMLGGSMVGGGDRHLFQGQDGSVSMYRKTFLFPNQEERDLFCTLVHAGIVVGGRAFDAFQRLDKNGE